MWHAACWGPTGPRTRASALCGRPCDLAAARRDDAVGFLAALVAAAPQHVAARFLAPALRHYAALLAPSQRARSVQAGSAAALLQVTGRWSACAAAGACAAAHHMMLAQEAVHKHATRDAQISAHAVSSPMPTATESLLAARAAEQRPC